MVKIPRRPTGAAVARSLREISILWRPPDGNDNGRVAPAAGETGLDNRSNSTPTHVKRKAAR